eukprot:751501-Hanusia_phi.AAC.2
MPPPSTCQLTLSIQDSLIPKSGSSNASAGAAIVAEEGAGGRRCSEAQLSFASLLSSRQPSLKERMRSAWPKGWMQ